MRKINIVDAFTTIPETGNRAGVVLNASDLTTEQMQKMAAFAGFSETAFVLPATSSNHDLIVRYFTPSAEVPICGHATIATHYLRATNEHISQYPMRVKTGAGILSVSIVGTGGNLSVVMVQDNAQFEEPLDASFRIKLAAALGIKPSDFAPLPIQVVSTGHSKVMVPFLERTLMDSLSPQPEKLAALSEEIECNGFFTFVLEGSREKPVTYGRMFAPAIGIFEDPVTGNANGPAGAYLVKHDLVNCAPEISYIGNQGVAMDKPGKMQITVRKEDDKIGVTIAGQAVFVGELAYNES